VKDFLRKPDALSELRGFLRFPYLSSGSPSLTVLREGAGLHLADEI
jgi:hypothetical protein